MIRTCGVVCGKERGEVNTLSYLSYGVPGFFPLLFLMLFVLWLLDQALPSHSLGTSLPVSWTKSTALPYTKGWPALDPGLGNRLADGAAGSRSLAHLSVDRLFATGHLRLGLPDAGASARLLLNICRSRLGAEFSSVV
jgi:hypothetical protein